MSIRKILITSALPYANGSIHLGHMLEHIQTDIWARFQKMNGHICFSICADDAHGTPIMLKAEELGLTPEEHIAQSQHEHEMDFKAFHIDYDQYHSTHSPENQALSEEIYLALKAQGYIEKRKINQLFDPEKGLFLPDRFVKGTCPKCHTKDQYGDNCDQCGATYNPTELIDAKSALSGATPITKASEHFFFDLPEFSEFLQQWLNNNTVPDGIKNKLQEWFDAGLQQWDISRDAPYFGFKIPGESDKYFYVWLDAPIGYMASFKKLCEEKDIHFDDFWGENSQAEIYHNIGKDIAYFHCLFWPAMLKGAGFKTPDQVFVHGFVTVNGAKMSKSKGTFITAKNYLKHLDPDYLRYYFASKSSTSIIDIDLNFDDFIAKVNADLVGKVVNIASRCAGFIHKYFSGRLASHIVDTSLLVECQQAEARIAECYEQREFNQAMKIIMSLADKINQYVDIQAPWILIKDPEQHEQAYQVCSIGINAFRLLVLYLKPVLPALTSRSEAFLNDTLLWQSHKFWLLDHPITPFKALLKRIDPKQIIELVEAKQPVVKKQAIEKPELNKTKITIPKIAETIDFSQFAALDLRIAKIVNAEAVNGADKLIKLTLDIGIEQRQVFAGIKKAYQIEELIGRFTVMVANLEPRKMRFGLSEGMILAAGPGDNELFLLSPDSGAVAGMQVK